MLVNIGGYIGFLCVPKVLFNMVPRNITINITGNAWEGEEKTGLRPKTPHT